MKQEKINLQNIQVAHAAEKKNQSKNGRRPKQMFLQRRHKHDQETHEKMLNFAYYQRNAT